MDTGSIWANKLQSAAFAPDIDLLEVLDHVYPYVLAPRCPRPYGAAAGTTPTIVFCCGRPQIYMNPFGKLAALRKSAEDARRVAKVIAKVMVSKGNHPHTALIQLSELY